MREWLARWWWALLAGIGAVCAVLVAVLIPRRKAPQTPASIPVRSVAEDYAAREREDVARIVDGLLEADKPLQAGEALDTADERTDAAAELLEARRRSR